MPIISGGSGSGGAGSTDGWTGDVATWAYVSATSFKIAGVDVTATFTKGTRLKLTQSAAVKYFVVVSSAFSTDTTVTITGGTDYTLANAAITANAYSYAANPQGYPSLFTYTPGTTGCSPLATDYGRFAVVGKLCTVIYDGAGTSNSTAKTFVLPIAVGNADGQWFTGGLTQDNGARPSSAGLVELPTSGTTVTLGKTLANNAWTASGAWELGATFTYEI